MNERKVTLAVTQMACSDDAAANADRAEALVRRAASAGAQIVLLQELVETPYFCKSQLSVHFDLARRFEGDALIARFAALAGELGVVIPFSFYERAGPANFNTVAMIDADGTVLGRYRKSHIPQGPGYEEKFYFSPGDTGFRVWDTAYARIGVGICWDQWFPEAARAMALMGAELLLYPTAIGSEPSAPEHDSEAHWETVMRGHAGANVLPVAAANRIGTETSPDGVAITFYGSSFITDHTGRVVAKAGRDREEVYVASFDLAAIDRFRRAWGLLRDRRPELYGALATFDGGA